MDSDIHSVPCSVKPVLFHTVCVPILVYNSLTFPSEDYNQSTWICFFGENEKNVPILWVPSLVSQWAEHGLDFCPDLPSPGTPLHSPSCTIILGSGSFCPSPKEPVRVLTIAHRTLPTKCGCRTGCYSSWCNSDGNYSVLTELCSTYCWVTSLTKTHFSSWCWDFLDFLKLEVGIWFLAPSYWSSIWHT